MPLKAFYTGLFALISYLSVAQIHILSGTTVILGTGTTLSTDSSSADTLKIDSGAHLQNNGAIILSPMSTLQEQSGFPVYGSGYELYSDFYSAPLGALDPGGLGLVISTTIPTDSLSIKRYHLPLLNGSQSSIARSYSVTSNNNTGLGASIVLNYDVTELSGYNYNNLILYQSSDGGSTWNALSGNPNSYNVQSANLLDSLSMFSLFPFDFRIDSLNGLYFYHGDSIKIYYTLNGILNSGNFLKFEFSDSTGIFSTPLLLDSIPAINGSGVLTRVISPAMPVGNQYRLRLETTDLPLTSTDNGNDITIMEPLPANAGPLFREEPLSIYPNPAKNAIFVKGKDIKKVIITNELGEVVCEKAADNNTVLSLDLSDLPPAIYLICIKTSSSVVYEKLIKI